MMNNVKVLYLQFSTFTIFRKERSQHMANLVSEKIFELFMVKYIYEKAGSFQIWVKFIYVHILIWNTLRSFSLLSIV